MLAWTLAALEKSPAVDGIILVIYRGDMERARRTIRSFRFKKVIQVVAGGNSRMESVFRGLKALPDDARWVLVHDGARPLVTPKIVEETLRRAKRTGAAIAAVPVVPTIKQAEDGWVRKTLNRNHLWVAQTPQVFRRDLLEQAHTFGRARRIKATDDAALVEALGRKVRIVEGSARNIKVTTPGDLIIAESFLRS